MVAGGPRSYSLQDSIDFDRIIFIIIANAILYFVPVVCYIVLLTSFDGGFVSTVCWHQCWHYRYIDTSTQPKQFSLILLCITVSSVLLLGLMSFTCHVHTPAVPKYSNNTHRTLEQQ